MEPACKAFSGGIARMQRLPVVADERYRIIPDRISRSAPCFLVWQPVDVRISRHDPSQVYVYLAGAILCQAQEAEDGAVSESPGLSSDR
jgi:hypothetical protein